MDVHFASSAGDIAVCEQGRGLPFDEDLAKKILTEDEVEINVRMCEGGGKCTCWGCDITYDLYHDQRGLQNLKSGGAGSPLSTPTASVRPRRLGQRMFLTRVSSETSDEINPLPLRQDRRTDEKTVRCAMEFSYSDRAQVLVEALPYIQALYQKTIVVKYGGNAMISEELRRAVISDIILLKLVGINVVVVHGGGPEISAMLKKTGKESKFVNGLRYTDQETMDIVQMVLCGQGEQGSAWPRSIAPAAARWVCAAWTEA